MAHGGCARSGPRVAPDVNPKVPDMPTYSPGLSLATAAFELAVAAWALLGAGRRELVRPLAALLACLAGYQLVEVWVCHQPASMLPARLAFVVIAWLPPLGIHVIRVLSEGGPRWRALDRGYFAAAGLLSAWVMTDPTFVVRSVCSVVMARYEHTTPYYVLYGAFYMSGLFVMLLSATHGLVHTRDALARAHLGDVQTGTILFVMPSLAIQLVVPATLGNTPSVMCHFALLLGLALARLVVRERRAHETEGAWTSDAGLAR